MNTLIKNLFNRFVELNAKFETITINALSTLENDYNKNYKNLILQNLIAFAQKFTNFLNHILKIEHIIRNNVHRVSYHMHNIYIDVSKRHIAMTFSSSTIS